jgi:LemA protein
MIGYIVLGVLMILILYVTFLYNEIIRKRNATDNAFGSVDTMLKKRYDLIPNLVETVKQYMAHEATVFSEVTKLRARFSDKISNEEMIDLHNDISKKLNGIMISVENYPDLKASQNFLKLQASWNEAEEQISAARRYYNSAITEYNNAIQTFPSNLMARIFNFSSKKVFEIEEVERKNINAKDLFIK